MADPTPASPSAAPATTPPAISYSPVRIRVFIDYWNFQLTLNEVEKEHGGGDDPRFQIRWRDVGYWLAEMGFETLGKPPVGFSYERVIIYSSYDPHTENSRGFKHWSTTWLDRQPGVNVICLERRPKSLPRCPTCHREITHCPHQDCGRPIKATVEKGVDTFIATDMIRLAWENAYDVAVLATSDADLVPAVDFLNQKGWKILQAGFPPRGVDLATSCWASFDVGARRAEIVRP